ncbi:MAG: glycosyltransferase [Pyrinomonadaceae bacterium]|nr:glycosyltransferase [Sphingobacteriaceae bacterium]
MTFTVDYQPLISVIIPCYNQGKFLDTAIKSVEAQTYRNYEIVVVDDGSTDNTTKLVENFEKVKYVYQQNQGLSAARNTGIDISSGDYLVFLDSDDWLLPDAIETNLKHILRKPELAFVSGAHQKLYELENKKEDVIYEVTEKNYCHLLNGNYVAMIGAVLFQRWVFSEFKYDTSLMSCEDYDLYLKIVRKYPVFHHTEILAVYRFHSSNMSLNYPGMLKTSLLVLNRQKELLISDEENDWFKKGDGFWRWYYTDEMYKILLQQLHQNKNFNTQYIKALRQYNGSLYFKFMQHRYLSAIRRRVIYFVPDAIKKKLLKSFIPSPGNVYLGDLNRTTPFSTQFGYDRGGPVDRYYIENFLEQNKERIKGRVLEIGDNEYTLRFGEHRIQQSDILHVNERNQKATFIGDLSDAPVLPDDSFDCIILTQTLHLIYQHQKALATCYRVLKPGGILLLTVPGISHIDQGEWKDIWLWSFTQSSISRMLAEVFSPNKIAIQTHGNVLIATAFLYGMGLPEFKKEQLDENDPHYQVIVTASAIK